MMDEKVTISVTSKKLSKKALIGIIAGCITLAVILLIYFGFSIYFNTHYYFGTKINDTNCYGKTASQAEELIKSELDNYTLKIEEKDSKTELINAQDIKLKAVLDTSLDEIKKSQNPLAWPASLFKKHTYNVNVSLSYNADLLDSCINNLTCMQDANMTPFVNASIEYKNNTYSIVPESIGTTLDKEKTKQQITSAIEDLKNIINLDDSDCYQKPTVTSTSDNIVNAVQTLNTYIKAKITYNILGNTEVVDASKIHSWLIWNENFEVSVDNAAVSSQISEWANAYNTSGKSKTFNTSYGSAVTIPKGDYGWKINSNDTKAELIASIQAGETVTKEPVYSKKAASTDVSKDYGNTYVEINLGTQHLYYYQDGNLVIESDFVSGKVTNGNATPIGVYSLKYKQSPAVLRGADYTTPVSYWMPFNGGVGLHDATWRSKFGGNIYYNGGSHGCINLPSAVAKTIYQNISANTAIIVYDLKIENTQTDTNKATDSPLSTGEQNAAETEKSQEASTQPSSTSDINNLTVETPAPQDITATGSAVN